MEGIACDLVKQYFDLVITDPVEEIIKLVKPVRENITVKTLEDAFKDINNPIIHTGFARMKAWLIQICLVGANLPEEFWLEMGNRVIQWFTILIVLEKKTYSYKTLEQLPVYLFELKTLIDEKQEIMKICNEIKLKHINDDRERLMNTFF